MNKSYKVIWSKVKGCYVVVSEIAKRCSKSSSGRKIASGVLSLAIMAGVASPVMAEDAVVYDDDSHETITLDGPIGQGTVITGLADGQLSAASMDAVTGAQLYATNQRFNEWDSAMSNLSSAVGVAQADISNLKTNYIIANSAINTLRTQVDTGINVLVNGAKVKNINPDSNYFNFVPGDNIEISADGESVKIAALGNGVVATGDTGLATGGTVYDETRPAADGTYIATANTAGANLTALDTATKNNADAINELNALAVQYDSNAKEKVTLGGASGTKIDNLIAGALSVNSKEAVNGSQLFTTNENLVQEITDRTAGDQALSDRIGTLAADGTYIKAADNVSQNLSALDTALKNNADGKANIALDNINDDGKAVIQNATNVVSGDDIISVTSATAGGVKTYTVKANISADGAIENGNTGLVSGGTVFDEVRVSADGEYIKEMNTAAQNLTALDTQVKANADAIDGITDALDEKANVDASNLIGHETEWGTAIGTGSVEQGNGQLVTGGTVFDALQAEVRPASDGTYIKANDTAGANLTALDTAMADVAEIANDAKDGLDGKANTGLDNITDGGKTVIRDLAKESVKVINGSNTTVTEGTDGNAKTYAVNVAIDGAIEDGNAGLVSGGDIYEAIQNAGNPNVVQYDSDAHDTVTFGGTTATNPVALKNVADGSVAEGSKDAVNGGQLFTVQQLVQQAKDGLDGKANTGLDNITDGGKTVIRDLAKASVKVINGSNTTVTEGTDGDAKTYAVNVKIDGAVEDGNAGLVNGGDIYEAMQNANDPNAVHYDSDAHDIVTFGGATATNPVALKNVADGSVADGSTDAVNGGQLYKVQELAQDAKDGLDGKANVDASNVADHTADWGSAIGTGAVANGNGELVTGGTVYSALQAETRPGADGTYIKASDTAGANLSALDTALADVSNIANQAKNGLDGKANTGLDNITEGGKTVIRDLAKDSVKVINGTNTTVTEGTDGNAKTYAVNVNINGALEDGNAGLVSGGDIYEAIQNAKDPNAVQYDTDAHDIVTFGSVGSTSPVALKNVADGSVANGSKDAVNGGQLFDVQQLAQQAKDGLDGKANVDASNVSDYATEWGTAIGTGAVADGNGQLVTGGTVYSALKDATDTINTALDGKANISLDNIDASGKSVITGLIDVVGGNNIEVTSATDASGKKTFTVSTDLTADGKVIAGDTGLISGDTIYNEVRPGDGTYVGKDSTTAENLNALDTAVNNLSANAIDYDFATKKFSKGNTIIQDINLTGRINANGGTIGDLNISNRKISGLSNATLSETSTEAVNGSQLFAVNQNLQQEVADRLAGDQALSDRIGTLDNDGNYIQKDKNVSENLSALDTKVKELADIGGYDANAIHYDGADKSKATLGGANGTTLTNVKDGALTSTSMDAVNGRQLFATNQNVTANTNAINDINDRIGTTQDGNYISSTNTVGENLGALDSELKNVSDTVNNFQVEIDGKANVDLDNISDAGKTVINDIAKNAVKVTGSGYATVTSNEVDGAMVYNVDVQANGQIAEGDDGLITGGTVYEALQNQAGDFADALAGKANVDASNVTDAEAWGEKIATGKIEKGDVRAVSGDTVAEMAEGFEADLHYKANKDLSNITIGGREVIRETMKEDLDKKADITYVDAGLAEKADKADLDKKANVDASNIKVDAWDKVLGTGEVAEGETHLVNGGTVYDAIQKINRNNGLVEIGEDDTITIGAKEGGNVIDVSNKHGEGRVIKGVMTDPTDASSAANVGYVNAVGEGILEQVGGELHKMNGRVNRVGANAAAMASLEPVFNDGDERWTLSASLGNFRDETAAAVGLFYRPSDKVLVNVRGTVGSSENMVGGGVSVALDKGENLGLSKAQLTREVRVMRAEREQDKAQIAQQNMKLMEQDQKIARLEAMMRQMTTQKK